MLVLAERSHDVIALEDEGIDRGSSVISHCDRRILRRVEGAVLQSNGLCAIVLSVNTVARHVDCLYVLEVCLITVNKMCNIVATADGNVLHHDARGGVLGVQETLVGNGTLLNGNAIDAGSGDSIGRTVHEVHVLDDSIDGLTRNSNVTGVLEACTVNGDALVDGDVFGHVSNEHDGVACLGSINCLSQGLVSDIADLSNPLSLFYIVLTVSVNDLVILEIGGHVQTLNCGQSCVCDGQLDGEAVLHDGDTLCINIAGHHDVAQQSDELLGRGLAVLDPDVFDSGDSLRKGSVADLVGVPLGAPLLLVDVGNGGNEEPDVAHTLHQSQLLGSGDLEGIVLMDDVCVEGTALHDHACGVLTAGVEDPGRTVGAGADVTEGEGAAVHDDVIITAGINQRIGSLIQLVGTVLNGDGAACLEVHEQCVHRRICGHVDRTVAGQSELTAIVGGEHTDEHGVTGISTGNDLAVQVDGDNLALYQEEGVVLTAQSLNGLVSDVDVLQNNDLVVVLGLVDSVLEGLVLGVADLCSVRDHCQLVDAVLVDDLAVGHVGGHVQTLNCGQSCVCDGQLDGEAVLHDGDTLCINIAGHHDVAQQSDELHGRGLAVLGPDVLDSGDSILQGSVADLVGVPCGAPLLLVDVGNGGNEVPDTVLTLYKSQLLGSHDLEGIVLMDDVCVEGTALNNDVLGVLAAGIEDPGRAIFSGTDIVEAEVTALDGDDLVAAGVDHTCAVDRSILAVVTALDDQLTVGLDTDQVAQQAVGIHSVDTAGLVSGAVQQSQLTAAGDVYQSGGRLRDSAGDCLAVQVDRELSSARDGQNLIGQLNILQQNDNIAVLSCIDGIGQGPVSDIADLSNPLGLFKMVNSIAQYPFVILFGRVGIAFTGNRLIKGLVIVVLNNDGTIQGSTILNVGLGISEVAAGIYGRKRTGKLASQDLYIAAVVDDGRTQSCILSCGDLSIDQSKVTACGLDTVALSEELATADRIDQSHATTPDDKGIPVSLAVIGTDQLMTVQIEHKINIGINLDRLGKLDVCQQLDDLIICSGCSRECVSQVGEVNIIHGSYVRAFVDKLASCIHMTNEGILCSGAVLVDAAVCVACKAADGSSAALDAGHGALRLTICEGDVLISVFRVRAGTNEATSCSDLGDDVNISDTTGHLVVALADVIAPAVITEETARKVGSRGYAGNINFTLDTTVFCIGPGTRVANKAAHIHRAACGNIQATDGAVVESGVLPDTLCLTNQAAYSSNTISIINDYREVLNVEIFKDICAFSLSSVFLNESSNTSDQIRTLFCVNSKVFNGTVIHFHVRVNGTMTEQACHKGTRICGSNFDILNGNIINIRLINATGKCTKTVGSHGCSNFFQC